MFAAFTGNSSEICRGCGHAKEFGVSHPTITKAAADAA
jgi:hypothetical protein